MEPTTVALLIGIAAGAVGGFGWCRIVAIRDYAKYATTLREARQEIAAIRAVATDRRNTIERLTREIERLRRLLGPRASGAKTPALTLAWPDRKGCADDNQEG